MSTDSKRPAGNPVAPSDGYLCSVKLDNFDSYSDIFGNNWPPAERSPKAPFTGRIMNKFGVNGVSGRPSKVCCHEVGGFKNVSTANLSGGALRATSSLFGYRLIPAEKKFG